MYNVIFFIAVETSLDQNIPSIRDMCFKENVPKSSSHKPIITQEIVSMLNQSVLFWLLSIANYADRFVNK